MTPKQGLGSNTYMYICCSYSLPGPQVQLMQFLIKNKSQQIMVILMFKIINLFILEKKKTEIS